MRALFGVVQVVGLAHLLGRAVRRRYATPLVSIWAYRPVSMGMTRRAFFVRLMAACAVVKAPGWFYSDRPALYYKEFHPQRGWYVINTHVLELNEEIQRIENGWISIPNGKDGVYVFDGAKDKP